MAKTFNFLTKDDKKQISDNNLNCAFHGFKIIFGKYFLTMFPPAMRP